LKALGKIPEGTPPVTSYRPEFSHLLLNRFSFLQMNIDVGWDLKSAGFEMNPTSLQHHAT
jgi:hypothetical protein